MLEESWSGNAIRRDSVSSLLFRRNILIAGTRKRHASSGTPVSLGQTPIGFQLIRPRIELCRTSLILKNEPPSIRNLLFDEKRRYDI